MMSPYFEDLHPGFRAETDAWSITTADIIEFARQWDPQPFHLDAEAARSSIFGRLVASGLHTYAISMRLCVDAGVFTGNAVAGLSVEKIRFLAPVYPDDVLRVTLTVSSLRKSASKLGFGVVSWDVLTTEQSMRPVLSANVVNLFRCRGE